MSDIFKIVVDYCVAGIIEIKAKTFKEALKKAENCNLDNIQEKHFIDGSFNVNKEMSEYFIEINNICEERKSNKNA